MPFCGQPTFCDNIPAMTIGCILANAGQASENGCGKTYYAAPAVTYGYQVCKKTTTTKDNTTLSVTDLHTKKTATNHTCIPQPLCAPGAYEPTPDVNLRLQVQPNITVEAPSATRAVSQPEPQVTFNVEMQPEVVTRTEVPTPASTSIRPPTRPNVYVMESPRSVTPQRVTYCN